MSKAEKQEQEEKVARQIEDTLITGRVKFIATRMSPANYSSRALNVPAYSLAIGPDTVSAYLPYMGMVHAAAAIGRDRDMTIDFTSTDFTKKVSTGKKNWNLKIMVNDDKFYAYRLLLTVSKTGTATLTVSDSKRQSVSFSGYLEFL